MTETESLGNELRHMGVGDIVDGDIVHAALMQQRGENLGGVGRVAVHGGISDHDALFFGFVFAPFVVFVDEPAEIASPDRSVQRAKHFDVDGAGFGENGLNLRSVLANDVGEVTSGIGQPVALKVDFVVEEHAVQSAEGAESIGREEHAIGRVKGHHDLRPVNHGGVDKEQIVFAEREGVKFVDNLFFRIAKVKLELIHHLEGLLGGDNGGFRMGLMHQADGGAVIRLHMVDDDVIEWTAGKGLFNIVQVLIAIIPVDGIEDRGFFVQQHVGVVGHAAGDGENVFEKGGAVVIGTDPVEIVTDFANVIHKISFLSISAHRLIIS